MNTHTEYDQTTIGQGSAYAQLQELGGSDYEIRDGEPDITGWDVKTEDGTRVGKVDELLFDPKAMKVRYIVLKTDKAYTRGDEDRQVLIPIGLAKLHTKDDEVILPGIAPERLGQLSPYKGWSALTAEVETSDRVVFEPGYTTPYQYPEFYAHEHFDEDRFYSRGDTGTAYARETSGTDRRFVERREKNKTTAGTTEVLNDLVAILNDRIEGYTRAKSELDAKEPDINELCLAMIDESRTLRMELGQEVSAMGEQIESDTTTRGKIYRAWMDVKAAFTGADRHAVLAACEYGEDAAQRAYKSALEEEGLPASIRAIIEKQKAVLRASHDKVKALRDASA